MNNDSQKSIEQGLKLIAKSSVIVFIALFLSKVLTYTYRIIIARYYGPEVYGLFSLAMMILAWFVAFSSFGFTEGLLRYVSWYRGEKQEQKIQHLFRISTTILFFSGIISGIILFLFAETISVNFFHNSDLIIFLKVFSFLIPIYLFANVFLSILQAYEKIAWHSFILNVFQNAVKVILIILLISLGFKTNAVIFSFFFGIFSLFLLSYLICKYKIPELFRKPHLEKQTKSKINKEFFSYSWPLLFAGIVANILLWADSFTIGYFKGATAVGLYNAAIPITILIRFAPELFLKLFFPLVTKEYARKNFEVVKQLSQQVAKWIFVLNFPLFLIIFLFPGEILNLLFGTEYIFAANALRILAVGSFSITSIFISYNLLSMAGKTKLLLLNTVLALIFNVALNIWLVPKPFIFGIDNSFGIVGAAFATTIVNIFLSLVIFFQAKHYTSIIPAKKNMIKIFCISLIPFFIIFFVQNKIPRSLTSFFLLSGFFLLVYTLLILITGCLDKNDLKILKGIRRKVRITK